MKILGGQEGKWGTGKDERVETLGVWLPGACVWGQGVGGRIQGWGSGKVGFQGSGGEGEIRRLE